METGTPSLSIILLMYNEAGAIARVLEEHLAFARARLADFEILVVDDGSTDGSPEIVRAVAAGEPRVRMISHARNGGMGAGMRTGIREARKELLVFNAADGQVEAGELGRLLDRAHEADIVLSTYENRRETLARELMSRAFRLYLRALCDVRFELQGLYLYPTARARELEPLIEARTFFFSFELIQRGLEGGLTQVTTSMRCQPRLAGSSKVTSPRRILRVSGEAARYAWRRALYE